MQKAALSAIAALLFLPSFGFGQAALTDQQIIEQINRRPWLGGMAPHGFCETKPIPLTPI
jgi:hypothetical protein